jgi:hypothetical protein
MTWMDLRVPPFDIIRYMMSVQLMLLGRKARISTTVKFAFFGKGRVFGGASSPKLDRVRYALRSGSVMSNSAMAERDGAKKSRKDRPIWWALDDRRVHKETTCKSLRVACRLCLL